MIDGLLGTLASGAISTGFNNYTQGQNNKFSSQMFQKQKDFWYEQQEYNSPANQVERLKEAGLNPQFMLGNIQSGQLGSSPSPMSPTAAQAANYGAVSENILKSLQGKTQLAQKRDLEADAFLKEISGMTQGAKNLAEIADIIARTDKSAAEALRARVGAYSQHIMTGAEWRKTMIEGDEIASRMEMNITQNEIWRTELEYLPEMKKLQMQSLSKDIALKVAQKELTLEQAKKIWYESNDLWHTAEGKKIDNSLKQRTFEAVVEKAIQETIPDIGRYGRNLGDWFSQRHYGEYPNY